MYVQFVIAVNCQLSLKEFCLHLSIDSPTLLYPSQLTHKKVGRNGPRIVVQGLL